MSKPNQPAIPAASLIVARAEPKGAPQFLMVRRAETMTFAPGCYVFPGGRVDPDDVLLGRRYAASFDRDDAAGRICAIRETLEETGLALGFDELPTAAVILSMRMALLAGERFSDILLRHNASINPQALRYYSRWCPRHQVSRIFDTRFYLTCIGTAMQDRAETTNAENSEVIWTSADALLGRDDLQERIMFPTRAHLARLAQFGQVAEIDADLDRHPAMFVQPDVMAAQGRVLEEHCTDIVAIPEGLGYPLTSMSLRSHKKP